MNATEEEEEEEEVRAQGRRVIMSAVVYKHARFIG